METVGVHMDRQARKSAPFAAAVRNAAEKHLEPAMA
jgi:acyl-CoA thioester hydrolase